MRGRSVYGRGLNLSEIVCRSAQKVRSVLCRQVLGRVQSGLCNLVLFCHSGKPEKLLRRMYS